MSRKRTFLTARWRNLLLLNFQVDPAVLAPFVPRGTEIDYFQNQTYVSIVGFSFLNTRVLGLPIPGHRNFEEINLRFYVRRKHENEWRRGVVFIKEIVPRRAIAWVARTLYEENYVALPMRSTSPPIELGVTIEYGWQSEGRWNMLAAAVASQPTLPAADSLESFIVEHYWGYTRHARGGTSEYGVEHPPWPLAPVIDVRWDCDVPATYGTTFAETLSAPPHSTFLAAGSQIIVRRGERLSLP